MYLGVNPRQACKRFKRFPDAAGARSCAECRNARKLAIVEKLGLKDFVLLGHSMGGLNAMDYTSQYPDAVERLIILDIGPEVEATGRERIQTQTGTAPEEFDSIEDVYELMRSQDPVPPDDMLRHRATYAVRQLSNGRWTWNYDKVLRTPAVRDADPTVPDLWEALSKITCPTLVIRGEASDILSPTIAARMLDVLPNGQLAEVPRAGHRVPLDNASGFEEVMRSFLGIKR